MIPSNWNNITLEQYQKLQKTSEYEVETDIQILNQKIEQTCIITGLPEEEVEKLPFNELNKVKELIETDLPEVIVQEFVLNGIRYRARLDPTKCSGGDYITIMNLAKKGDAYLHQIIFTICKPIKKGWYKTKGKLVGKSYGWHEYDFEAWELEDRIKDFKQLTMNIVNPLRLFFLNVSIELTESTQAYLENVMKMTTKELESIKEDLQKDMDGL